jgi:hypothetical protein
MVDRADPELRLPKSSCQERKGGGEPPACMNDVHRRAGSHKINLANISASMSLSNPPPRPPKTPQLPNYYDTAYQSIPPTSNPSYNTSFTSPPPVPPPPQDYLRQAAEEQRRDNFSPPPIGMLAPQPRRGVNASENVPFNGGFLSNVGAWDDRRASSAQGYYPPPNNQHQATLPTPYPSTYGNFPPPSVLLPYSQPNNGFQIPQSSPTPGGFSFQISQTDHPQSSNPPSFPAPSIGSNRLSDGAIPLSTQPISINQDSYQRPPRITSMVAEPLSSSPPSSSALPTRPYSVAAHPISNSAPITASSSPRPFSPPNGPSYSNSNSSLHQSFSNMTLSSDPGVQLNLTEKKDGEIAISVPTTEDLAKMREDANKPNGRKSSEELKVEWAREILKHIEKTQVSPT